MRQNALRVLAALLLTIVSVTVFHWPYRSLILRGWNDFPGMYTAGALAGGPDLYHKSGFLAKEAALAGASDESIQFSRLPYYALLFRPLTWLPFSAAYWLWQVACFGALVGFGLLWPDGTRVLPILCVLPLTAASFANGQDVPFLLLWIALSFRLESRGHRFAAGLVLSLGMAKPHLFLFLPVALLAKREWRIAAGAASGALALIALSFAVGGTHWPAELMAVWRDPALHPQMARTSAVTAIGELIPEEWHLTLYATLLSLMAAGVGVISRRVSLAMAVSCAVACSVASAVHVYLQDYLLCLPLLLLLFRLAEGDERTDVAIADSALSTQHWPYRPRAGRGFRWRNPA